MAEDRTPDPADQPEDEKTPQDNPPEPYRLGGSGGSGKIPDGPSASGKDPENPFEAFFSSLAGGDMNALAAQLQSAFAMLFAQSSPTAMFSSDQRLMLPRWTAGWSMSAKSSRQRTSSCA